MLETLESLFDHTPLQVSDLEEIDSHELGLMNVVRIELAVMGLIPTGGILNDKWKLKLFRYYQNIMLCIYIPVMGGQLLAIYHFWGDVDIVTDCAGMFFVFVACFFDYLYIIEHEKGIVHACEVLEENPIPKGNTRKLIEKYLGIIETCRTEIRVVMEIFWGFALLAAIKWLIYNPVEELILNRQFLNHTDNDQKPNTDFVFIIWFPFDATWSPMFEIIYMFQSVLLVMATCHNICANSTFLTFMVHAWGKLEIVECTISSIEDELYPERVRDEEEVAPDSLGATITEVPPEESNEKDEKWIDSESGVTGDAFMYPSVRNLPDDELQGSGDTPVQISNVTSDINNLSKDIHVDYLTKCIKQHQTAIEFVHEVDDLVTAWLGVRMFAFQMVAIGEVFQVIVSLDDWSQFLRHLVVVLMIMAQILIYCWFGDQVIEGGWDVEHAVYMTPWYTYSRTYKKHLVLVIMRAHRPVEITVGHYYSLSLESCELILQNIYFFSMFLNQINNKANRSITEI